MNRPSWRRALSCLAVATLTVLAAGPAGAETGVGVDAPRPGDGGAVLLGAAPAGGGAPIQPLATANRMINGDGGTSGKCMEIAGGTSQSELVQMAPCRSYAHQGWTLTPYTVTIIVSGGVIVETVAYQVSSHDRDAAGRCLTYLGRATQTRMLACGQLDNYFLRHPTSNGWFQLESLDAWANDYLPTGDPASRDCLDVHVDRSRTTNIVQHWTCGPSNKGNQLFRIQAA